MNNNGNPTVVLRYSIETSQRHTVGLVREDLARQFVAGGFDCGVALQNSRIVMELVTTIQVRNWGECNEFAQPR